jgi:hypothetical protein
MRGPTDIAKRTLTLPGRKQVVVRIGCPQEVGPDTWGCTFRITGGGLRIRSTAHGVDAVQALVQALRGIVLALKPIRREATWVGGGPGELGFPEMVPIGLGKRFETRIARMVEKEAQRQLRRRERAVKARKRPESGSGA